MTLASAPGMQFHLGMPCVLTTLGGAYGDGAHILSLTNPCEYPLMLSQDLTVAHANLTDENDIHPFEVTPHGGQPQPQQQQPQPQPQPQPQHSRASKDAKDKWLHREVNNFVSMLMEHIGTPSDGSASTTNNMREETPKAMRA